MRAFVTGATGFIGERVARRLRERDDEVVALVRSPHRAEILRAIGCQLVRGDLADREALRRGLDGAEACFHVAGGYRVGVSAEDCEEMREANVTGTEHLIDAAVEAGVKRIVYVSTVNVFGNTKGRIVDETHRRNERDGFLSCYDETKYRAHQVAEDRIAKGAPVVIVQPGVVYGPGDHSGIGTLIDQARRGGAVLVPFGDLGFNAGHVDDVAEGILLAHDRGNVGQSYVIGGEIATMLELATKVARLSGHKPPKGKLPTMLVRMAIPFGPLVGRMFGMSPNLRETIRVSDGVTYWATDAKARKELGYSPRDLDTGLANTLAEL
jgi:dihydroflavonol-4-reductase